MTTTRIANDATITDALTFACVSCGADITHAILSRIARDVEAREARAYVCQPTCARDLYDDPSAYVSARE